MLASNGMNIQFDRIIQRKLNWIELHPDSLLSLCSHRLTAALLKVIGNRLHKTQKLESDRSFEIDDFKGNVNMEVIHFVYQFSRHFLRLGGRRKDFCVRGVPVGTKKYKSSYNSLQSDENICIQLDTCSHSNSSLFCGFENSNQTFKTPSSKSESRKQAILPRMDRHIGLTIPGQLLLLPFIAMPWTDSGCPFAVKFRSQLTWPSVTSSAKEQSAGLGDFLSDFASSYWEV